MSKCNFDIITYSLGKPCLQVGVGKKAEAVATVVAAVDQARVREPREPTHVEESYSQQTMLEYGYKEHISTTKVPEQPRRPASEPHLVPQAVKPAVIQAPSETHIKTTDQMGMHISSQVSPRRVGRQPHVLGASGSNGDVTELHLLQVKKTTDISTERLVHVDKRPRTASPHFTVSKISVPKTEHGYEVRCGG